METTHSALTGIGVHVPPNVVTNEALCACFNAWVEAENAQRADGPDAEPLRPSSPEFVVKVSGIEARRFYSVDGVLDPTRMVPRIPDRADGSMSVQGEFALQAARRALDAAGRHGEEVDLVIVGASSLQRPYPAVAIELQAALGARGVAYDISVGCSSGVFGIQLATESIRAGSARCALVCTPELPSAYANFRDRESHFILGDASAAVIVEPLASAREGAFEVLATHTFSLFSSAVRNNGGFLNRCDEAGRFAADKLFYQDGPRVFRDIVRLIPRYLRERLGAAGLTPDQLSRFWLHQANGRMNDAIGQRLLGDAATAERLPSVLADYANTASAGALLAFHAHSDDLPAGALGVLCAFGAGYTVGSQLLRRI